MGDEKEVFRVELLWDVAKEIGVTLVLSKVDAERVKEFMGRYMDVPQVFFPDLEE